jgi:AraC-like DNA-binding protein
VSSSSSKPGRPSRNFQTQHQFDDVESTDHAIGAAFYPVKTSVGPVGGAFKGELLLHSLGPMALGEVRLNAGVLLTCPDIVGAYHVNVPASGSLKSRSRGVDLDLDTRRGAIYREDSQALLSTGEMFHVMAIKFDSHEMTTALSAMIGRPVDEGIRFEADIRLDRGLGQQWWEMVQSTRRQLERGDSLIMSPVVSRPLAWTLINGFLLASTHQFSEELHSPSIAPSAPAKLAEELIQARLTEPITIADIASEVGISIRALQRGFVRYFGVPPSEYLRTQRLRRAHADLVAGDPAITSVADVAARWGFVHLGRFAAQYRQEYQRSPSVTLRS